MNFFRNMDLYKGLILACLLLLPVGGYWVYTLDKHIDECHRAIAAATRKDGVLEEIGQLERKMDLIKSNRSLLDSLKDPGFYFDKQIRLSDKSGTLSSEDFSVPPIKDVPGRLNKQQKYIDKEQDIVFGKKGTGINDRTFGRDFIWALLYNCESGAGAGTSIWKLRKLDIQNATDDKKLAAYRTPLPELEDKWIIRDLKFARRQPDVNR